MRKDPNVGMLNKFSLPYKLFSCLAINEAPPTGNYSQYKINNIKYIIKFNICFFIFLITVLLESKSRIDHLRFIYAKRSSRVTLNL